MLAGYLSAQCHSRVTVSSPSLSSLSTYAMCALQFALLCLPAFCTQTVLCFHALHSFCTLAFKCVATLFTQSLLFANCQSSIAWLPASSTSTIAQHISIWQVSQSVLFGFTRSDVSHWRVFEPITYLVMQRYLVIKCYLVVKNYLS